MLSAIPGVLCKKATVSIDLNSCKESLFDTVKFMLVTLSACLIGLMLSCSKWFVQVPRLPWGAEAPEQAKGMQLTIQSQVSNEYKSGIRLPKLSRTPWFMLHDFAGVWSFNPVLSCHLSMSMYLVLDYQVLPFEEDWYQVFDCTMEQLPRACWGVWTKDVACWYEVPILHNKTKSTCDSTAYPWKTEARSDICECHVNDFPREAYSLVVDVDQKVYFWFTKVNICFPLCHGDVV